MDEVLKALLPPGISEEWLERLPGLLSDPDRVVPPGWAGRANRTPHLPRVDGGVVCLTCGCGPTNDLPMGREIAVGFGSAGYKKDGVTLWEESQDPDAEEYPTVASVEALAKDDPDHDWRIFFYAPLYESEYQRQAEGAWVLIRKGEGFA